MTSQRPRSSGEHRGLAEWLVPTRTIAFWFVLYAVIGLVACFIPLFNRVGYESAALFGAVSGFVVPFLTLHADEPGRWPSIEQFGRATVRHLSLLLPPLAFLTANALRVQNCDFTTGFAFWLSIPIVTTLLAQCLGYCALAVPGVGRWTRRMLVVLFVGATIGWFLWRLAMQPPITGHQWMIGYFSGSIYDEALTHPWSLVYYRLLNLTVAGAAMASLAAGFGLTRRSVIWAVTLAVVCTVAAGFLWHAAPDNGVAITRDDIERQLGGRTETEHFIIHHPETERFLERRDALAEDHEFRYREMREFFETHPADDTKIHSYVYRDRDQKAALMGGRSTMVARIWLKEMHILWPRYGDHMLAHELAHIFTHPFGSGPLRLSADMWVGVNMGLVEGIATAADWPVDEMTPHQASAALKRAELAPDLRNILGAGGFWSTASSRAYTLTGSFLRYLRDRYGIDRVKAAYPTGDFEGAFGQSVAELVSEWEAYLDSVELDDGTMELVRYLYRRPSIFTKVCPRTIGSLEQRARHAAARGDVAEAKRVFQKIIGFAPANVDFRLEFAELLLEADEVRDAVDKLNELRQTRELAEVHRANVLELLGDARWHLGEIFGARRAYRTCLDQRLPAGMERFNRVKLESLNPARDDVRALAFTYLVDGPERSVASFYPTEWSRRRPDDTLAAYLVGRRLWASRAWDHAIPYLRASLRDDILHSTLRPEARRILARSLYFAGRVASARQQFEKLQAAPRARYRWEAREWLRRISFE